MVEGLEHPHLLASAARLSCGCLNGCMYFVFSLMDLSITDDKAALSNTCSLRVVLGFKLLPSTNNDSACA